MKNPKRSKLIKKMLSGTAALVLTTAGSLACAAAFNAPADVEAIKAIEHDLATQTSMKELIKHYAPDAIVLDIFAPGTFKGTDAIYKGFEEQMSKMQSMKSDMPDINIATNGNFACAAMTLHFNAKMTDGSTTDITLRQRDAFKEVRGKWLIVQQHSSLPVDAKTGMAVVNGPLPVRGPIKWAPDAIPAPSTTPENAKAEIKKWLDVGVLSDGIDQLMEYYGPGDDVLVYDTYYPGELRGLKELRKHYTPIMSSYSGAKVQLPDLHIDSDGAFGIQIDTQTMVLDMKDGSKKAV